MPGALSEFGKDIHWVGKIVWQAKRMSAYEAIYVKKKMWSYVLGGTAWHYLNFK